MFGKFRTVTLVLFAVFAALLIALAIPTLTLAAPPIQAPDPTAPADLAQVVGGFLDLMIALAVGGGVAYLLQMSDAWKRWESPLKPLTVLVLTALIGGALSSLKVLATAELFATAPDWGRAFIGWVTVFFGSQLTYQKGFQPRYVQQE